MTGTLAYILAKKKITSALSGISNITLNGNQIVFQLKDGTQLSMYIPIPADGISITKVEINTQNHLICTLSDGSTLDAGEIPGGKGGGLETATNLAALPKPGDENTLYLTLNDETLYYWNTKLNKYSPISGGSSANGIEFKTAQIEFDDINTTFDLPVDNKSLNVYINGMYLTEGEDYTIDNTVTPNTITFVELWESTDLCTLTWINGKIDGGGTIDNASFATKEDIDKLFTNLPDIDPDNEDIYATKEDIDKLFAGGGTDPTPDASSLATKQDIDKLFN